MEGPKIAVGAFPQNHFGNWGPFVEASLFRIEAKCVGLHVRLEPNWNTCAGLRDGQFRLMLAGFGISIAVFGGIGLSTPLGGIGLRRL